VARHCPTCNRSSADVHFYGDFCETCTLERLSHKLHDEVQVMVCKRCGRIKLNNQAVEKDDAALEELLAKSFKDFEIKLLSTTQDSALIELNKYDEDIRGIRKEVLLRYKKFMCQKCNRQSAGYYEGVIQLRGNPEKCARMLHRLEKYYFERDEFISKIEKVNNGVDLYVSSKKLASGFMAERGLKPTMSYELYGLRKGQRLYRNTYALHFD